MRSTPTAVTQSLRLAFRLKPIRSVQSECTLFLPASIRMYENSSGAVSGETKLPHHAFHSAICINCNSSSLIRQLSQSIIVYHQDEPSRCCQSYTHNQCS